MDTTPKTGRGTPTGGEKATHCSVCGENTGPQKHKEKKSNCVLTRAKPEPKGTRRGQGWGQWLPEPDVFVRGDTRFGANQKPVSLSRPEQKITTAAKGIFTKKGGNLFQGSTKSRTQ